MVLASIMVPPQYLLPLNLTATCHGIGAWASVPPWIRFPAIIHEGMEAREWRVKNIKIHAFWSKNLQTYHNRWHFLNFLSMPLLVVVLGHLAIQLLVDELVQPKRWQQCLPMLETKKKKNIWNEWKILFWLTYLYRHVDRFLLLTLLVKMLTFIGWAY